MSEELERLRADLEVIKRLRGQESSFWTMGQAETLLTEEIARLEAEAADPWQEAKTLFDVWERAYGDPLSAPKIASNYVNHLTAERNRLAARVAELEAALKRIATVPDCGCVPCRGQCDSVENLKVDAEEIREIARAALQAAKGGDE